MDVVLTRPFGAWIDELIRRAKQGDELSVRRAKLVLDQLKYLHALEGEPNEETKTLKQVVQSQKFRVWRVSHPFTSDIALRLICWFDASTESVVVVLFAGDKARMGNVFYDSVGMRADQLIEQWKREGRE